MGNVNRVWVIKPIKEAGYGDVSEMLIVAKDKEEAFLLATPKSEYDSLSFPITIEELDMRESRIVAVLGLDL